MGVKSAANPFNNDRVICRLTHFNMAATAYLEFLADVNFDSKSGSRTLRSASVSNSLQICRE